MTGPFRRRLPGVADPPSAEPRAPRRPHRAGLPRAVMADRRAWIAVPVLLLFAVVAAWPSWFDGVGPWPCPLEDSLVRPNLSHPFGRDVQGCDLFARTVHGTRNSMLVGVGAVGVAALVAAVLGSLTALSSRADGIVRLAVDLFLGIPVILVGMTVLAARDVRGPGLVIAVLSFFGWPLLTRVMRAEVLRVSTREYVDAARAMGAGPLRVVRRHIAPNSVGSMLALAVLTVATMITTEAVLTFLGVGLQMPNVSWGILLAEAGTSFLRAPHLVLPGIFLVVATAALVMLAEAVRDARPPS